MRFAPAAWRDRLFVACDDGHLYALSAADGAVLWKVRGGPSDRRILGNERIVSAWPARGGPVVEDDVVYRRHSDRAAVAGTTAPWIANSGCSGPLRLRVNLTGATGSYTLRLHFTEPQAAAPGQRIFDVAVAGQIVLSELDIARQTAGGGGVLVKELPVRPGGWLEIELKPREGKLPPVLGGVELQRVE